MGKKELACQFLYRIKSETINKILKFNFTLPKLEKDWIPSGINIY